MKMIGILILIVLTGIMVMLEKINTSINQEHIEFRMDHVNMLALPGDVTNFCWINMAKMTGGPEDYGAMGTNPITSAISVQEK